MHNRCIYWVEEVTYMDSLHVVFFLSFKIKDHSDVCMYLIVFVTRGDGSSSVSYAINRLVALLHPLKFKHNFFGLTFLPNSHYIMYTSDMIFAH